MDRMLLKFATLSAQEIPKLKSLASFKMLTFKDLKAAKMALATKEDAEPVLRLAKLMGLIGDSFSGSTLDVFILASQQAGARDSAQVQAVSLPVASPSPPASESAMTASAPADILVTVVETTQPAKSHRKNIPMCANNTRITSFFGAAPPSAEPLSQSSSQPSANRQPSSNPVGVQKPKSKMKILHAKILRAGDYTKLKNSVAQLRRDARTFSATKAEHDREMDTLKKELLFARSGVISEYSATTMQRTHRDAVLATSLVAATRRSTMLKLEETLARNFAPDVRKIWAGRGGKLNPEFAGACLNLVYECGISVEKLSLAILYVFGALFPGTAFSGRLPSPATWRNALLDFNSRGPATAGPLGRRRLSR